MCGCGKVVLKRLLAGMHIVIICVAVGMIAFVADNLRHRSLRTDYSARVILIILNGILLISIAATGVIVCLYEWANIARVYAAFLVAVVLVQASVGTYAITQLRPIGSTRKDLEIVFTEYSENKKARQSVDGIQKDIGCCGVDGPEIWSMKDQKVPDSCKDRNGDVHEKGCLVPFHESIIVYVTVVSSFHFFYAVFLAGAAGLVFYLARSFKELFQL